jgi:CDP-diacylglycerol--glycerol-3-phosphate 3-phosphatidyltransferase/cardiolipin synthase
MTPATYITMLRLLLVPVFAVLAVYYAQSFEDGVGNETIRWWAVTVFAIAALTDLLDGFLARRFDERTKLGAVLDPIADKLLVLTAVIILSIFQWGEDWSIPIWFTGLVIVRDAVIWGGIAVLHFLNHQVEIKPHWTGKACTALLMVTVAWTGLKIIPLSPLYPTCLTAVFLVLATFVSIRQGIAQLQN